MLQYSSEDKLFDALALIPVTRKSQLRLGDRVKVKYSGWDIKTDYDHERGVRRVIKKQKIDEIFSGVLVDANAKCRLNPKLAHITFCIELCIELDGTTINTYTRADGSLVNCSSGELKNFKKGWDGKPGVGASWGGTGVGGAFLTSGCKIIGKYA